MSGLRPLSIGAQLIQLRYSINRISVSLKDYDDGEKFDPTDTETEDSVPEEIEEEEIPVKPKASGKSRLEDAKAHFLAEVRRIRKYCEDRAINGETIDSISMRPIEAAARLLHRGIPSEALLHAMSIHWPQDARRDAGIVDFNVSTLSKSILKERGIVEIKRSNGKTEKPHTLFGYCLTLVEARQPVMAIGPAGTGKSHLAKQIADYLEMSYAEAPMTPGATRGDLLGRHTIAGFISAEFVNIYSGGGVFNFEEIDAADPGMLIVLNNALSSDALYNPVNGEQYEKHESFSPFATANTFGLGANRQYTGREKLDAATIDRWRMGRVFMAIDENVESSLLA
jgi:hypothetical protein